MRGTLASSARVTQPAPGVAPGLAAPGTPPALEAHLHIAESLSSKSRARVQLFARQHRSWLTSSEARLWSARKARQLGVSFRRQVVIGSFIADFCAPSVRLIVEEDGLIHARKLGCDARRERKPCHCGFRVVRVPAELVLGNLAAAVELVRAAL